MRGHEVLNAFVSQALCPDCPVHALVQYIKSPVAGVMHERGRLEDQEVMTFSEKEKSSQLHFLLDHYRNVGFKEELRQNINN